ncbi:MAG TPA: ClpXP protease specificity-enhancing factor SspB [Kofleriaceae bacterium]|jgi:stringent starvation protein B|nr:ClpXP protease specificity-enhancing factor SspB [Kofleriaceae bacterium]
MIERDPKTLARLQVVVTALIEHRVSTSLVDVERALARWRNGGHSALAAHGAVLRHAARCERTVERVTAAAGDRPEGILRDAVDAGLMTSEEFVELVGKQPSEIESIGALRDDDDASAPDKRRTLEQLLGRGPVLVHVDARRADVVVPPRFREDASLVLRFGFSLAPPIRDLVIDDDGISGTLTFGGSPFHVGLPWTAVYAAMVEGEQRGTVWPEDVPEDVLAGTTDAAAATAQPAPPTAADPDAPPKRATHLKLVD